MCSLFGNVEAQKKVTRMLQLIISLRENLLTYTLNQGLPTPGWTIRDLAEANVSV